MDGIYLSSIANSLNEIAKQLKEINNKLNKGE